MTQKTPRRSSSAPGCSSSSTATSSTTGAPGTAATGKSVRSESSPSTSEARSLLASLGSEIDLAELPPRLQAIAATMGQMLSDGCSKAEIAEFFGKSRPWVSARLLELKTELELRFALEALGRFLQRGSRR